MSKDEILASSALFTNIPGPGLYDTLCECGAREAVRAKGERLYASSGELAIVMSGGASIYKRCAGGHEMLLDKKRSGSLLGAAGLFGGEGHVSEVIASEECSVLLLNEETLCALFAREPRTALNYIAFLTGRINYLNRRMEELTGYDARSRLGMYLLQHADSETNLYESRMNTLSSLLNIGRASLYRALDQLEHEGALERCGRNILIHREKLNETMQKEN